MNHATILQTATQDYFRLIQEELPSKHLSQLKGKNTKELRHLIPRLFQSSGLISLPGNSRGKSSFEVHFDRLLDSVAAFWETRAAEVLEAARCSDSYKITLQSQRLITKLEAHLRRLGLYFDTIFLVDPIHIGSTSIRYRIKNDPDLVVSNKFVLLERLAYFLSLEELLSPNVDRPLFVILPDVSVQQPDGSVEEAACFLGEQVLGIPGMDSQALARRTLEDEEELTRVLTSSQVTSRLVQRFTRPEEEKDAWLVAIPSGEFKGVAPLDITEQQGGSLLLQLWQKSWETLFSIRETLSCALAAGTDPVVYYGNEPYYSWLQERIARSIVKELGGSEEEQITVTALLGKDLEFLEAVTLEDLRNMREEGHLEEMREALRLERKDFKNAISNGVESAAQEFQEGFLEIIDLYGRERQGRRKRANRKAAFTGVAFGATAAIGIAAVALPAIVVLGALGTAIGLAVGGKSALDTVRAFREASTSSDPAMHSPLAILYEAKERWERERTEK